MADDDEVGTMIWPVTLAGDLMTQHVTVESFADDNGISPEQMRLFIEEFCDRGWLNPIVSAYCNECGEVAATFGTTSEIPDVVVCRVCAAEQDPDTMSLKVHYFPDKEKMAADLYSSSGNDDDEG